MASGSPKFSNRSLMLVRVGGIALLVGLLGYRTGFTGLGFSLGLFALGVLFSVIALVMSLFTLTFWRYSREVTGQASLTLVLALGLVVVPVSTLIGGGGSPAIHHITTDPSDPPRFDSVIPLRGNTSNSLDYTAELAKVQRQAYPDIQPLLILANPAEVFGQSEEVIRTLGWQIVDADRAAGRIEATDTTFWFGFKDDIVIRIRPTQNGSRVDLRSVSRVGGGDIGANAARIREFSARLRTLFAERN